MCLVRLSLRFCNWLGRVVCMSSDMLLMKFLRGWFQTLAVELALFFTWKAPMVSTGYSCPVQFTLMRFFEWFRFLKPFVFSLATPSLVLVISTCLGLGIIPF